MNVPDYTDPVIILGLMLVCVYAYMGGRWLDRRNKIHADRMDEQAREERMKDFKDELKK